MCMGATEVFCFMVTKTKPDILYTALNVILSYVVIIIMLYLLNMKDGWYRTISLLK